MKKLLLLVTGIVLIVAITKMCTPSKPKNLPQTKSHIRDSLDKIAIKLTGTDFCNLSTVDVLNYAEAAHKAEKKYPLPDPDLKAAHNRMTLEESLYRKITDSTIKASRWPDTIMTWVNKSSLKLDTPCNQISLYHLRESIGRDRIKGIL